jgi:hypothetical protein
MQDAGADRIQGSFRRRGVLDDCYLQHGSSLGPTTFIVKNFFMIGWPGRCSGPCKSAK